MAVPVRLVEPVHPRQGREFEFELVDGVPAVGVGSVHALGLGETVGCLDKALSSECATVWMRVLVAPPRTPRPGCDA